MVDNLTKPAQIAYQGIDDSIKKTENLLDSTDGNKGFLTTVKTGANEAGKILESDMNSSIKKTEDILKNTDGKKGLITSVKEGAVEAGEKITQSLDNPIKKTEDLLKNGDFRSGLFSSVKSGAVEAGRAVDVDVGGPVKKTADLIKSTNGKKGFFSTLKDGAVEAGASISKTLSDMKDKIFNMKNLVVGMVAGAGTKKLFDFSIGNAASYEQYETSFKVLMGSADQAKAKLQELSSYANTTPFQIPEVIQAGRTLMTFGLDTQTWIKNAGNLAAATNANIGDVATAMGRIKAGDFGEAFERMRDFGISKQMLEAQGLKFDKSGQYVGSVDQALSAINTIVNQKFGGMTEEQGKTFNGLMSTFQDSISNFGRSIGEKAFPQAKEALTSLMAKMDEMSKNGTLDRIANVAGNAFGHIATGIVKTIEIIDKLGSFVAKNWSIIEPILVAAGTMVASMMIANKINNTISAVNKLKKGIEGMKGLEAVGGVFKGIFGFGPGPQALIAMVVIAAVAAAAFLIIKNWGPISEFFKNLWKDIKNVFAGIGDFFKGVWDSAKSAFNTFWEWLKGFMSKWGIEILAVLVPFIGIPLLIIKHWDDIKAGLQAAWDWIKNTASNVFNGIANFFKGVWQGIKDIFSSVVTGIANFVNDKFSWLVNGVKTIFNGFKAILQGIWEGIKLVVLGPVLLLIDLVTGNFTKLREDAVKIFTGLRNSFSQIWQGIRTVFTGVIGVIVGYVSAAWNGLVTIGKTLWNGFRTFITSLWNGIVSTAKAIWNGLTTFFVGLWNGIKLAAINGWNALKNGVISIVTGAVNMVIALWEGIISFFTSLPGRLYSAGVSMFTSLKNGISSILSTLSEWIVQGFNGAINFITSLPAKALEWGKDFIDGLINGIKSKIDSVVDAVKGVGDKIRSFLHFSVPDEGPLTDYESWMPDFMEGMASGIKVKAHVVTDKISDLAVNMREKMQLPNLNSVPQMALAGSVSMPIVEAYQEENSKFNSDFDKDKSYKKIDLKEIIREQRTETEKHIFKNSGKKLVIQKLEMHVKKIENVDDLKKQLENETNGYMEDDD